MRSHARTATHVFEPDVGEKKLRVLLVPDSIHWITGTIGKSIVENNTWIAGTLVSGPVLEIIAGANPEIFTAFDLVHFLCPYASRKWLPLLRDRVACVTSHHHVTDWDAQRHNLEGDAIVAGSPQWVEDAIERGVPPERIFCVPYGVDTSRFAPPSAAERASARDELTFDPDDVVVGFFAKRSSNELDRKGTDVFAAAIQLLRGQLPNLAVLIIGPGWHDFVATLRASGVKCVWLPLVRESAEMPRMYWALDFYWVTARIEGGPVTLLEAMSTGVCCVATPVGLAREILVDDVNGVRVPFDDPSSVAQETLLLARDDAKRSVMGTEARSTILTTMDVKVTSRRMREVYAFALAEFAKRVPAGKVGSIASTAATDSALPSPLKQQIAMLERLTWAESLMLHRQRSVALRIIAATWLQHPRSTVPLRYLIRNLLPKAMVMSLVNTKKRFAFRASK